MTLKEIWHKYNPFDLDKCYKDFSTQLETVKTSIKNIDDRLSDEIDTLEFELAFNKGLLNTLAEAIPDMLWLKNVDGVYLYANSRIREQLLFCNPIGNNDIDCSKNAKQKFGSSNHTFGEICGNSDKIILETLKPQRFLESGMIKGKMMYLEVYKAPFYVEGVLIGVCGTGRDMTPYIDAYNKNGCSSKCPSSFDLFSLFEFKNKDI